MSGVIGSIKVIWASNMNNTIIIIHLIFILLIIPIYRNIIIYMFAYFGGKFKIQIRALVILKVAP